MLRTLSRHWWVLLLRGLLAILFGILAILSPGITGLALVLLFGAYVFVDGIFSLIAAFRERESNDRWWVLLLEGLAGIAAGVVAFVSPQLAGLALVLLIAAWALITGVFEIVAAIRLRKELEGEWLMIVSGILSILLAVLVILNPVAGAAAFVMIIGIYAIIFGIVMIMLAFRLRGRGDVEPIEPARAV